MAWQGWPVAVGDEVQSYGWSSDSTNRFLLQLWKAARERDDSTDGVTIFPRPTRVYYGGTIETITETMLTDANAGWAHVWHGYIGDPEAQDYDVIIEGNRDDPRTIIQRHITFSALPVPPSTQGTLEFEDLSDWLATNSIPSLESLVGQPYFIIRKFGTFWAERWPEVPNEFEYATGVVTSATADTMTDDDAWWSFPENALVGYDLVTNGSDGKIHRLTIIANSGKTLEFDPITDPWIPEGVYTVVQAEKFAWPGRVSPPYLTWYRTGGDNPYEIAEQWYSHQPQDGIHVVPLPKPTLQLQEMGEEFCQDEALPREIYDQDVYLEYDDECNERDVLINRVYPRTLRFIQNWLDANCTRFVEPDKDYTAEAAIPNFRTAAFHHFAGIGKTFVRTITAVTDGKYIFDSLGEDYIPPVVHYCIRPETDEWHESGIAENTTNTELFGAADALVEGMEITISFGWIRTFDKEFRYLFGRTVFIPDIDYDPITSEPFLVYPPNDEFPGTWMHRDKSTYYTARMDRVLISNDPRIVYGTNLPGEIRDNGGHDGGGPFVEGDAARYVGDNYNDPTFPMLGQHNHDDPEPPTLTHEDWFFTGRGPTQDIGPDSGTVTSATSTQLTDTSKNWWSAQGGVLLSHTGTPTTITTTSIADTTKAASAFWTTPDRLLNLVLEIQQPGADPPGTRGALHGTKRIITGQNVATQALTFDAIAGLSATYSYNDAGGSPQTGNTEYRIREPLHVRNRWQDHPLVLTNPDTSTETVIVTHSDDQTLFFPEVTGFTITEETTYRLVEPLPGVVLIKDEDEPLKWRIPDVEDVDTLGGENWVDNIYGNQPHSTRRYGKWMLGDHANITFWNELYRSLQALRWVKQTFTWTADGVVNTAAGSASACLFDDESDSDVLAAPCEPTTYLYPTTLPNRAAAIAKIIEDAEADYHTTGITDTNPTKISLIGYIEQYIGGTLNVGGPGGGYKMAFGFGQVTVPDTNMECDLEWYVHCVIDEGDPDEGIHAGAEGNNGYAFDANGDGGLYREWASYDTTPGVASGATQLSVQFGDLSIPNWATTVAAPPITDGFTGANSTRGYLVTEAIVIRKYDVEDGYFHQPPVLP